MRELIGVGPSDDFAVTALGAVEMADVYEPVVARHHSPPTVVTWTGKGDVGEEMYGARGLLGVALISARGSD